MNKATETIAKGVVGAAGIAAAISGGEAGQYNELRKEQQYIDRQKTQETQRQQDALRADSKSKPTGK